MKELKPRSIIGGADIWWIIVESINAQAPQTRPVLLKSTHIGGWHTPTNNPIGLASNQQDIPDLLLPLIRKLNLILI